MQERVLIPQNISSVGIEFLQQKGYEIKAGCCRTASDIMKQIRDCSALLVRNARIDKDIIDAAPNLKVIARHGVGIDNIDVSYATEKHIWVTNAPESNFNAVAEQVLMFLLQLSKNFIQVQRAFSQGGFDIRNRITNMELKGKTLGIVGFGKIGRAVAQKADCGLGMNIMVFDPYIPKEKQPETVVFVDDLEEIFSSSDFVTLHMPITPQTRGLIDGNIMKKMKPSAYLINAARQEILNEQDLVEILQKGAIAGAAIDVYASDPPDMKSPLFTLQNVILTPHNAAHTHEAFRNMALHAALGIYEVLSGQRPTWPVNSINQ
jgi:D-3-phosphoglycerate dehydrogenase